MTLSKDRKTVTIIGPAPAPELLEQIKHRIGPDEAAVVVDDATMQEFLRENLRIE